MTDLHLLAQGFVIEDWRSFLVGLLPAAGILLLVTGLVMSIRNRRRSLGSKTTAREQVERLKQKAGVRDDLTRLMVELEEYSRRMGAQLDAKAHRLERLIEEADQRLAQLQDPSAVAPQGLDPLPASETLASPPPTQAEDGFQTGEQTEDDALRREVCDLADQGYNAIDISRQVQQDVGKVELILALRQT